MKISVIIPAYNEEKRILPSLKKILKYLADKKLSHEVIVVNDGSTDGTLNVIKNLKNIKVIGYKKNRGKGYAVKTGVLSSKGDYFLICDADLSTPIEELDNFLKYKEDIIIGSRALKQSKVKTSFYKKIMGRIGNLLISLFAVKGIKDTQCGFKLFKKKCKRLFEKQTIDRWGFDFEILFLAQKNKFSIKELPVHWTNIKGSKVKFTDYFKTLSELIKIRINFWSGKYK